MMAGAGEQDAATQAESGFILSPQQLGQKILEWKHRGFHVLSPAIQISTFAPGYAVNASLVLLNPSVDKSDGGGIDVYFDKNTMEGSLDREPQPTDERAPSKIGLLKIAAAAGVSWVNPYGRVDPLTIPNLWIYNVTGVYLAYDGTPQVIRGEKEIDYRDGSAQIGEWSREAWKELERRNATASGGQRETHINGWSERRVRQARTSGAERAETGALERAIRTLGIKHTYTIAELKRPFVALRVCPMVDMTDPDVRRQVTMGMLGGVAALYAGVGRPELSAGRQEIVIPSSYRHAPEEQPVHRQQPPQATPPQVAPPRQAPPPPPQAAAAPSPPVAEKPAKPPVAAAPQRSLPPQPSAEVADDREARGDEELPLPEGAVYIRDVRKARQKYSASNAKAGQEYTKWTVTDSNGVVYVTVFAKWGSLIDSCAEAGRPVIIKSQERTFRGEVEHEILNVQEVGPREPGEDRDDEQAMQL